MTMKFTRSCHHPIDMFFGGGHNASSDPANAGWKCRSAGLSSWLLGQDKKSMCAIIDRSLSDSNKFHVYIHNELPQKIAQDTYESVSARSHFVVDGHSGFGLKIIRKIEEARLEADIISGRQI